LLGDSDRIRTERKKAKSTKSKYTGVGSDDSGFGGSGKKYGGFGSDDLQFGSYSGQVYGIYFPRPCRYFGYRDVFFERNLLRER
jgi:hypothetical protein